LIGDREQISLELNEMLFDIQRCLHKHISHNSIDPSTNTST
jgi:hypothetical protein